MFPGTFISQPFDKKHAVMCCDATGTRCVSPDPCKPSSTYLEAVYICSLMGLRLCSENDNIDEICCDAGCGVDSKLMWISSGEHKGTFIKPNKNKNAT